MMLPQVTMPMGSSMGHVRNLDLSDLFLDIYHFYTKPLLIKTKHGESDKKWGKKIRFSKFQQFCFVMMSKEVANRRDAWSNVRFPESSIFLG